MRVAHGLDELAPADYPAFVVVGVFDGLHLGHAYLLRHLVAEADARGARPMVVTFDHHPDELIRGAAPPLLCDPGERFALLESAGVSTTVIVHFDQRLRETAYDAFVAQLAAHGRLAGFLMTPDAAFGYGRSGNPEALAALGQTRGFEVVVVPPFELDGLAVRSSEIRAAIEAGDLDRAALLLGRPHTVVGVVEAAGRTAVLRFEFPVALPPDGAWPARLHAAGASRLTTARVIGGRLFVADTSPGERVRVELLATKSDAR